MSRKSLKSKVRSLYYNKTLRIAVLTGMASALAYLVASFVPLADPFIAAITGLVAVSPTFHNSIKNAFAELAGVVLGAVVGLYVISWLGFNLLTLGMLVSLAFILSWALRLGTTAAVPIGVTMILVSGPLLDNVVGIEGRILGVLIGAVMALIASYFVLPGQPHQRAVKDLQKQSLKAAELLSKVAKSLSDGIIEAKYTSEWVALSHELTEDSKEFLDEAKDAVRGAKWSPMLSRKETAKAYKKAKNLNNIVTAVNNICEDLNRYVTENKEITPDFSKSLSSLLHTTAEKIVVEIDEANSHTGKIVLDSSLQSRKQDTLKTIKNIDETQAILLGGSIIGDATRIRESLK